MKFDKRKRKKVMWIGFSVIASFTIGVIIFINQPCFGRTPKGERLERIKSSPNYRDNRFQNLNPTEQLTSDKSIFALLCERIFEKKEQLRPETPLPAVKTNLHELSKDEEALVWFGHSSYLLQLDGIRVLVDPVFIKAAPVSFINKPFKGTDIYKPDDIPNIDYLIISHDHWDHLDHKTILSLKDRVGKIVCGLGVGEHLERWGVDKNKIVELDWDQNQTFDDGFTIYCLPARHFSGRGLFRNKSLWASFLIQTPSQKIYLGGDSGYDTHYKKIGEQFGEIDLAILENGQYSKNWKYIHLMPEYLVQAFMDLNAKRLFTVHHSKYALADHPWNEPLENISKFAQRDSINLILPMIGEVVNLKDSTYTINKWWEGISKHPIQSCPHRRAK